MHELSLMQGLISQVEAVAEEQHARKVLRIVVTIGPFSGVVVDSFQFAFDALRGESRLLQQAELLIDVPSPVFTCSSCGRQTRGTEDIKLPAGGLLQLNPFAQDMKCPHCATGTLYPSGGDEIMLMHMEME